jgi:hypothetical protein
MNEEQSNEFTYTIRDDSHSKLHFPLLDDFVEAKKGEITEYVENQIQRLKHITAIHMDYITEHSDKEIQRIKDAKE